MLFKNIWYCFWNYRLFRKWEANETNKPLLQWIFMIAVLINYSFIHVMCSSFFLFPCLRSFTFFCIREENWTKMVNKYLLHLLPIIYLMCFLFSHVILMLKNFALSIMTVYCDMLRLSSWYLWLNIIFASFLASHLTLST